MEPISDPDQIRTRAEFAAALTRLRESAGLTVRELAKQLGTPAGTLGDYFSGRHLPSLAQLPLVRALLGACGVDEDAAPAWLAALARARAASDGRVTRASGPMLRTNRTGRTQGASPYPGLKPFDTGDAELFFGREAETQQILTRLAGLRADPGPSAGLLAVVGPSGSGKSSLLRAGVAAAIGSPRAADSLADNAPATDAPATDAPATDSPASWTCAVLTPGADPAAALAAALRGGRADIIVIDQFEEVFTSVPDATRRDAFLRSLPQHAPGTVVVFGMRADFYADAAREPVLLAALQHAQVVVGPLSPVGLSEAIVRPAQAVGLAVENGLVDVVTAALAPHDGSASAHDAGALPLMAHALRATWELSPGRRLTIDAYRQAGGIEAAVQQTAEDLYASLGPAEQQLTRRIFLRLINLDDVAVTRRRVGAAELGHIERPGGPSVAGVVDRFVERRLLTVSSSAVEISHEALLSAWPRLRDWVDADRAGLRQHRQLTEAATAWQQSERDATLLLRGARLETATEWAADPDHRDELDPVEHAFLDAGLRERSATQARERGRTRRLRRLLSAVAVLAVVAAVLAGYALRARSTARHDGHEATMARNDALSRQVAFQSRDLEQHDPALAEQLALVAYKIDPTEEARGTVIDQSTRPVVTRVLGADGPTALAVSPDGRLIAVSHADDGSVHLYRTHGESPPTAAGVLPGSGTRAQVFALAFSPHSDTLALGGQTRRVGLWDVRDAAHPHRTSVLSPGFTGAIQSVAFSPDGRTVAAGSSGPHPVQEWDVAHPTEPVALDAAPGVPDTTTIQAVAFSPDGSLLAAGGDDDMLYSWPTPTPVPSTASPAFAGPADAFAPGNQPIEVDPDAPSTVAALAFGPESGHRLYVADKTGAVTVWSDERPGPPVKLAIPLTAGGDGQANTLDVSPDGAQVAVGYANDTVQQFDAVTHTVLASTGNPGPVTGVRYSADGAQLLSTAADGTLRLWPATARSVSDGGHVFAVGYAAVGHRLLVSDSGDKQSGIHLWDARKRTRPFAIGPNLNIAGRGAGIDGTGALRPDGRAVAGGNSLGQVELWDVTDANDPRPMSVFTDSPKLIESLAFSPNGHLLAVGADDGTETLWDVSDLGHPRKLSTMHGADFMLDVAFSPDGRFLAGANADYTAHLWSISDPTRPVALPSLRGFKSYVYGVAFSPNSRLIAASGADHTVRVWSLADPQHPTRVGRTLIGATDYAFALAFSPNGKLLAVASADDSVRLYDVTDLSRAVPEETLTGVDGDAYTVAFSHDGHTLVAGGLSPALASWDVDPSTYLAEVCPMAGDPITRQEWSLYVPGARYDPPCS